MQDSHKAIVNFLKGRSILINKNPIMGNFIEEENDFSNQLLFKMLLLVCNYGGIGDSSTSIQRNFFFPGQCGLGRDFKAELEV